MVSAGGGQPVSTNAIWLSVSVAFYDLNNSITFNVYVSVYCVLWQPDIVWQRISILIGNVCGIKAFCQYCLNNM